MTTAVEEDVVLTPEQFEGWVSFHSSMFAKFRRFMMDDGPESAERQNLWYWELRLTDVDDLKLASSKLWKRPEMRKPAGYSGHLSELLAILKEQRLSGEEQYTPEKSRYARQCGLCNGGLIEVDVSESTKVFRSQPDERGRARRVHVAFAACNCPQGTRFKKNFPSYDGLDMRPVRRAMTDAEAREALRGTVEKAERLADESGLGFDRRFAVMVAAWNASTIAEFEEVTAAKVTPTAGDPYVTLTADTAGKPFTVTVTSATASVDVVETTKGTSGTNEVQSFYFDSTPTSGTYTITFDPGGGDETSDSIAYNANAATVKSKIVSGMASVDSADLDVTGSGTSSDPFVITWKDTYAATDVNQITVNDDNLGGANTATVTEVRDGGATSANQVDLINVADATFTVSVDVDGDVQTTSALNYSDTDSTVQTAIQGLSNVGSGNCTVHGGRPTATRWCLPIRASIACMNWTHCQQ